MIFLTILSSVLLYSFENAAGNEQFENGFSGMLYALTVLTGFGESEMEVVSMGGKVMVVVMIICGACVVGVPIGIISGEFASMVAKTDNQQEENEKIFEEFSKKLTAEQKLAIIAEYNDKIEKDSQDEEN